MNLLQCGFFVLICAINFQYCLSDEALEKVFDEIEENEKENIQNDAPGYNVKTSGGYTKTSSKSSSYTEGRNVPVSIGYGGPSGGVKTLLKKSPSRYEVESLKPNEQVEKICTKKPKQPVNAALRCTQIACKATCIPDFQFPNGETTLFISCVDGEWSIKNSEWDEIPSCEPICLPTCENNGICTSPGICTCPQNYVGPQCQYENKVCLAPPPLPKNSRRSCSSTACTFTCVKGHKFPDSTSITNMECKNGEWIPSRKEYAAIPDCVPTCTPKCQNGGNCLSYNVCQCPPNFRGPQCQYDVETCSAKKMNFNGGFSCEGSESSLSCTLSCPQGIQFSFPPADKYVCEYATGIFKPENIPQCVLTSSFSIITTGSSVSTKYKKSNHSSFSKTGRRKTVKSAMMEHYDDDDYDDEVEEITKTIKTSSKKKRIQSSLGVPFFEFDDDTDFGKVQLPGLYSVYDTKEVDVVHKTPKSGMCMSWNGNKIKTFDGLMYKSPLHCSHTMLQDRVDGSFSIILRGCSSAKTANYTAVNKVCPHSLDIFLQNLKYTFENVNGVVKLFSIKKQLPIPSQLSGLRVTMVGSLLKIRLETVQVTIYWDSKHLVTLQTSAALWNRTSGLCGTLDKNIDNDFTSKTGNILKNPLAFVDGWKTPTLDTDEGCLMERAEDYKEKICSREDKRKASKICKKLLKSSRLSNCLNMFDKDSLLASCIADYCNCHDSSDPNGCVCESISVIAKDCSFQGVMLEQGWRDLEICPLKCTDNRVYKACGPSFEPSCGSTVESGGDSCEEGCFCPEGTIQYESHCIKPEECPCSLRGKVFKPNSQIVKDCNTCTCEKGMWKCTDVACGSRCGAIGDPHYVTFDGKHYDFMGKCSYYLLKTTNLSVEAENVACPGTISEAMGISPSLATDMPSCTKSVTINIEDGTGKVVQTIQLKQGKLVLVDGLEISKLPKKLQDGAIKIRQASSILIVVEFKDGIKIWWDGMTRAYIDAPASYRGHTKGLCGTFNSNFQDDFLTPENDVETAIEPFADKWRTKESCEFVSDSPKVPHPCQINVENKAAAENLCSKIKGNVFDACHWSVDPTPFYDDCMYDVCACKGDLGQCMCPIFAAYATECSRQGVVIDWRYTVSECAVKCSPGQVYEQCGDACRRTCDDVQSDNVCKSSCIEGCRCPSGLVLDEHNECIPIAACQCTYKGLSFSPGYKEVRPGNKFLELCTCMGAKWNCKEAMVGDEEKYPAAANIRNKCRTTDNEEFTTCEPVSAVTCKNMHLPKELTTPAECRPGCVCKKGFVFDVSEKKCVLPKDCSCHHGGKSYGDGEKITEECNSCICHSGKWNCTTKVCASTCVAWGDSHFETYDGKDYDFQGACDYVLSKGSLQGGEGFSITLQNVLCGSLGVTCSKSIQISILGSHPETISLTSDSVIPGAKANLDAIKSTKSLPKTKKLMIHRAGVFIVVEAPGLGLQIKWDRGTRVYVKLENKWKGRVQGLCGNYNGDASDDLKTPSGGVETSPKLFGHAWKLQDFCSPPTEPIDACLEHPNRKTWSQRKCEVLKTDVFKACHTEVPVEKYLKRCIFDACACDQGGDCECLCTALAAYAHACAMRGVPIKWRTPDLCPMQCDPHCSSYSACISPCPIDTCDNLLDQGKKQKMCNDDTCVEGCYIKPCTTGEVYLNETFSECVPEKLCKPICLEVDGVVYYEGDVMKSDDCHTCSCTRGKEICSGEPCKPTTTEKPLVVPMHEEKVKCVSGWSTWLNQDKSDLEEVEFIKSSSKGLKDGDVEPVPTFLLLKNTNGFAHCEEEFITAIECRTVSTHRSPKSTGENVECSLEKGLLCEGLCHDYEVRVMCECSDLSTLKPNLTVATSSPVPYFPTKSSPYHEEGTTPITQIVVSTLAPVKYFESEIHPIFEIIPTPHPPICDVSVPHVEYIGDCSKFKQCQPLPKGGSDFVIKDCSPGTLFNPNTLVCDWPAAVIAIKPECGVTNVTVIATRAPPVITSIGTKAPKYSSPTPGYPVTEGITTKAPLPSTVSTTLPTTQSPKDLLCPPGYKWSDCALPCGNACDYFGKYLVKTGECKNTSNICTEGCVEEESLLTCPPGYLWRDKKGCVSKSDCTCMSLLGSLVKPGETFKESECEICQCIDNLYVCDESDCEETGEALMAAGRRRKKPKSSQETTTEITEITTTTTTKKKIQTKKLRPGETIILKSTVSPPSSCNPSDFVPLIEGVIPMPNEIFTASSTLGPSFLPQFARFNPPASAKPSEAWSPATNDEDEYLQITFAESTPLYGIIMKGSPVTNDYVTSFKILYSLDGDSFHDVVDEYSNPQVLSGPISPNNPVQNIFKVPIEAKIVRIYPLTWNGKIAIRTELLGCSPPSSIQTTTTKPMSLILHTLEGLAPAAIKPQSAISKIILDEAEVPLCDDPMGLENGQISPSQIKVSSTKPTKDKLKPYDLLKLDSPNGWRPLIDSPNEFITIDFLEPRNLTGIKTKGGPDGWVEGYKVEYSPDNTVWNEVLDHEKKPKVFVGNYDSSSPKTNYFKYPIKAQHLKVIPTQWKNVIELKVEPLGCFEPYPKIETTTTIEPEILKDCDVCPGVTLPDSVTAEACKCSDPLYWDGHKCTPRAECPCIVGSQQYSIGTKYELEDCSECICVIGGTSQCKPQKCPPCEKDLRATKSASCLCLCEPCPESTVICPSSGACIEKSKWCDGIQDCPDDEVSCLTATTPVPPKPIAKKCPEATCPPGFTVKISEKKSEAKLSAMFQGGVKTNMRSYTKTSRRNRKNYQNNLPKPEKLQQAPKDEECIEFTCVPERPRGTPAQLQAYKCPEPLCPPRYEVVMETFKSLNPHECAKYNCEPVIQNDAVCNVTGKTFNTFDSTTFKYEICDHVLARELTNENWNVILRKNCSSGNYTCHDELEITDKTSDYRITLYQDLTLTIDGYRYTVAQIQKSNKYKKNFQLFKTGNALVFVSKIHGFWVIFDKAGDVKLGVSSKNVETVDGLCGFFNNNPEDDKRLPSGEVVKSTSDFGDSWFAVDKSKTICIPQSCPVNLQNLALDVCNEAKNNVFKQCQNVIDVDGFISKCVETACECFKQHINEEDLKKTQKELPETKKCKCSVLQDFVGECLASNDKIELNNWRNIEECEELCPVPFVHKDCFRRRCEPSCDTIETDECPYLPGTCFSGCYCPEGTVRKDDQCVPLSECRDCVCDGFGKSQYVTYDRNNFTFDGNCTYLLSRDIKIADNHTFQVYATLGPCLEKQSAPTKTKTNPKTQNQATCTQALHIIYGTHIIHIQRGDDHKKLDVLIDGVKVKSNSLKEKWIFLSETHKKEIRILLPESQIELISIFDDFSFSIRVPSLKYGSKMEGLCGDCNKDPIDDFKPNKETVNKLPKSVRENPINEFAQSWLSDEPQLNLIEENCITEEEALSECIVLPPGTDPCLKILNEDIFGKCHAIVDPVMYVSACQQDLCKTGLVQEGVCESLAAYARECARNGICSDWRTDDLCPYTCPPALSYDPCGCAETCESIKESDHPTKSEHITKHCNVPKTEGCFCAEGKVLQNGTCVAERECTPCDTLGHFAGDTWYPDKCTSCECKSDGKTKCSEQKCMVDEIVCEKGFDPLKVDNKDECCPKFICVPAPTEAPKAECPEVLLPECGPGQQKKMEMDKFNCLKYICECKPISECDPVKTFDLTLKSGMKIHNDTSGCCPLTSLICDKSSCPPKLTKCSEEFYEVVEVEIPLTEINETCCDEFKCVPPKQKCIVTIDDTKHLKAISDKWPTSDPCISEECTLDTSGQPTKKTITKTCEKNCKLGFEYKPSETECCGKCVQTKCIIENTVYEVDQIWQAVNDNCTQFACVKSNDTFVIIATEEKCPDISECPKNLQYQKGCCTLCKPEERSLLGEVGESCGPQKMLSAMSVNLIKEFKPVHGLCINPEAIPDLSVCAGGCKSGTKFNKDTLKQIPFCKCCKVEKTKHISVQLKCEDGYTFMKEISVPEVCNCSSCEEKNSEIETFKPVKG